MTDRKMGFVPNEANPHKAEIYKDRATFAKAVAEEFAMRRITYQQAKKFLAAEDYKSIQPRSSKGESK